MGWSPKCQLWSAYGVIPPCGYTWASVALHGPGSPASLVTPSHFCCFLLSLACIYSTSFCLPQKPVTSTTSPCLWFPDLYLELKPFSWAQSHWSDHRWTFSSSLSQDFHAACWKWICQHPPWQLLSLCRPSFSGGGTPTPLFIYPHPPVLVNHQAHVFPPPKDFWGCSLFSPPGPRLSQAWL